MLKILVADDEGIAVEALKFIIENHLTEPYIFESAKTGRQVIEIAERLRPDIIFMDIQMPGINGVKAMQEIRKTNKDTIFIVVSAYETFDYAKDSIAIGVLEYLNKPIHKEKVTASLDRAIEIVKENQHRRAEELEIQEKLETVLPVIETGMIYSMLFQEDYSDDIENYTRLLGIEKNCGYIMVIRFGESVQKGKLTNSIGSAVKTGRSYEKIRSIIKEYTEGVVGAMMGNNVIVFVPEENTEDVYEERIALIDRIREMARILKAGTDSEYRIGIGSKKELHEIAESYHEALEAIRQSQSTVAHVKDYAIGCKYDEDYPIDTEKKLFAAVENGDRVSAAEEAERFFDWMKQCEAGTETDIQLKVLEFVLRAEKYAFEGGGMIYHFTSRTDYLQQVMGAGSLDEMCDWFVAKISEAAENVHAKKKESAIDIVEKAKKYIETEYKDISLDSIARDLDVSPYYFSKLFKEKTGENFIDYVTDYKIAKAKEMISANEKSMKEICMDIGYANPNYFSFIFKKKVGVSPSEYREGIRQ